MWISGVYAVLSLLTGSVRYKYFPDDDGDGLSNGTSLASDLLLNNETADGVVLECAKKSIFEFAPCMEPIELVMVLTLVVGLIHVGTFNWVIPYEMNNVNKPSVRIERA